MEQKLKPNTYLKIFWLELGINFLLLLCLCVWAAVAKNPQSQARFAPAPPMVLGAVSGPLRGEEVPVVPKHLVAVSEPDLSGISAKSFLVYNAEDSLNLLEKNIDQKLGIASLTKLLTAYVAYQNLNMASEIQIKLVSGTNVKPSLGLIPGDKVKVFDLFNSMLVGSENDAAETLSDQLYAQTGQTTASLMNQVAESIGMSDSHFGNPLGFDYGNNYSTAGDLKKIITLTQSLHAFTSLENKTNYSFTGLLGSTYFAKATNKLVGTHSNIYAIKTGYTETALGSIALKTIIQDKPVVVVVLGSQNREKDALKLVEQINLHFKLEP